MKLFQKIKERINLFFYNLTYGINDLKYKNDVRKREAIQKLKDMLKEYKKENNK